MRPLRTRLSALGVALLAAAPLSLTAPATAAPAGSPTGASAATVEEERLPQAAPQEILRRSGFDRWQPEFTRGLAQVTTYPEAKRYVAAEGRALWERAVDRVQGRGPAGGDLSRDDDRPLYWARLTMTRELRAWQPGFGLADDQRAALLGCVGADLARSGLDRSARGPTRSAGGRDRFRPLPAGRRRAPEQPVGGRGARPGRDDGAHRVRAPGADRDGSLPGAVGGLRRERRALRGQRPGGDRGAHPAAARPARAATGGPVHHRQPGRAGPVRRRADQRGLARRLSGQRAGVAYRNRPDPGRRADGVAAAAVDDHQPALPADRRRGHRAVPGDRPHHRHGDPGRWQHAGRAAERPDAGFHRPRRGRRQLPVQRDRLPGDAAAGRGAAFTRRAGICTRRCWRSAQATPTRRAER